MQSPEVPAATENSGMLEATSFKRLAAALAACALALLVSPAAHGQAIALSLNVNYEIPSDVNSGGDWELVALSTDFGLAAMNIYLTGINSDTVNQAPRGNVNGTDPAGFAVFEQLVGGYLLAQEPAFPSGAELEGAFYGVGNVPEGDPRDPSHPHPFPVGALTNLQDVPWASPPDDPLEDGPSIWDNAATLLSGTFDDGMHPNFGVGTSGRVFTTVGTPTMFGRADPATIGLQIVRSNFAPGFDYNDDNFIDAADYVVWRKGGLPQADGDGDGMFNNDIDDYDEWREHFAETIPGASGQPSSAVPEPASAILLFSAIIFGSFIRGQVRIRPR
jgi:hypothetical protein